MIMLFDQKKPPEKTNTTMSNFVKQLNITQLISQKNLDSLIQKWKIDKGTTKLSTQKLTNILILSSVLEKNNLRDISDCFSVPKSTLDDALKNRCSGFFQDLFSAALKSLIPLIQSRKERQEIREIVAIDSSVCLIHGSVAERKIKSKINRKVAGIKYHAAWNVNDGFIEENKVTFYRTSDVRIGRQFEFQRGKTYVFDRAYVDLKLWQLIDNKGAFFVTRLKKNGFRLDYIQNGYVENNKTGVLLDTDWYPSETSCYYAGIKPKKIKYRLVIYRDPESKKIFYFATSDFESPAQEIANIYRQRWAVELLFRWLKSHLNIRRFSFKNLNAIKILLVISSIVQLLVKKQSIESQQNKTDWDTLRKLRNTCQRLILETLMNKESQTNDIKLSAPILDLKGLQL